MGVRIYIGLIPVIIEALKDQDSIITSQNERIKALEAKQKKVSSLKNAVTGNSDTPTDIIVTNNSLPTLDQNFPNPFNQSTQIGYYLPETVNNAILYIYNMNGLQLKSINIITKGKSFITINGSEFQPGMYIYALIADGKEIDSKHMILTQ